MEVVQEIKIELAYDSVISLLVMNPKKRKTLT